MELASLEASIPLSPPSSKEHFYERASHLFDPAVESFEKVLKSLAFFNAIFVLLGFAEILLIVLLTSFLSESAVLAFTLALFFLTAFSYLTLRLYFQAKKPGQLLLLKENFLNSCKALIGYEHGEVEHHLAIASALRKLALELDGREYLLYTPPKWLSSLRPALEKFSCWCHWKDVHRIQETLFLAAIEEQIKLVKCEPTSPEVHAALANGYVALSSIYMDPRKTEGFDPEKWLHKDRYNEEMQEKFRMVAERAIEEFKILSDYAPEDPWVHAQLAYSYHDLQMPEEEIKEYETILKLCPEDHDALFKLGILYFQQGMNSKGLRVYEDLKRTHHKKAEALIRCYGDFSPLA